MAIQKDAPAAQSPILIDEATLASFHPKQGRRNLQGEELTAPEMFVAFTCEVDRISAHMNALTRLFRKNGAVRLRIEFVEQMELPRLAEVDPRARLKDPLGTFPNGNGKVRPATDDTPPRHIGEVLDGERPSERAMRESAGGRKKRERAKT